MNDLLKFLKNEIETSQKRYHDILDEMNSLSDDCFVSVSINAKRALHEEAYFKFFTTLKVRYEGDEAMGNTKGFVKHCLNLVRDEFKKDEEESAAISSARHSLFKAMMPMLIESLVHTTENA